ncbi:MAG: N-acetyltransferase [Eubacteriales bacterium]|nr:N-acetyltransferase [Eubacteriales bacterium]
MTQEELSELFGKPHFVEIKLNDMVKEIGEEDTKSILSYFSCPQNKDVETFLKTKAILFSQRELSKTTLVYWVSADESCKELVGYYTVAQKVIRISRDSISSKERRKLYGHGEYNPDTREYIISAPLIGQLGKNFTNGNDSLISGDELLSLAMQKIKMIQNEIGGRFAYLECEDIDKLKDFYTRNNFKLFGKRELDKDETDVKGSYLLQLFTML